ncbi:MAG: hypothetical protein Q9222_005823 [Ikaeria aurantiellina]
MDAEEVFLKSMKDIADAEAVQYGTAELDRKQTESISSDEYDPAQAVPDTFSPPARDLHSPGIVNQTSSFQSPDRPLSTAGNVAANGPQDQAVDQDDDRNQSRSMSGSSSSTSPVNIQTDELPAEVDIVVEPSMNGGGTVLNASASLDGNNDIAQSAALSSSDSAFQNGAQQVQPQNDVSTLKLSHVAQNDVPLPASASAAPVLEMETSTQDERTVEMAPVPPVVEVNTTTVSQKQTAPNTAIPKARLPHDRIGILEDRIQEDPRGDMDAWLSLIGEYRKRNKFQEVRATYNRFFVVFPAAAAQWVALTQMENEVNDLNAMENIFQKTLLNIPNLQLWSTYLDYIRRTNNIATDPSGETRSIITQAYEVAIDNIGLDKDSGYLWQEYIQFLKSRPGNAGGSHWQEQQKMDELRKAYQRAIKVPTQATQSLWKEYDQFEMSINKNTGRKFLQEESPAYMTARSSHIALSNITRNLRRTTLPKLPPAMGFDGDREYVEQLEIWKQWIQWEKDDPLVLKEGKEDERKQWRDRVIFVYKQATMDMRFWPEMWYEAAEFCFQNGIDSLGNDFLVKGIIANPESCLLAFKRADHIELTTSNEDGDDGIVRRGAAVREPYNKVLDALYELIERTKVRKAQDIAKIEAQYTDDTRNQPNGDLDDEENDDEEETDTKAKRMAAQIEAVKGVSTMQDRLLKKTITFVWIALMRAMRRIQGKGKPGDKIGGSRQIFSDARLRGQLTSDIFIASAMIEYHCYEPETTKKIFARGLKLFPEDEIFALEYIKHLTMINDHINARVIFETVVNKFTSKAENLQRAKPLYAFFHDFESKYGELAQVIKLEKRMKDLFPDDPALSHFSRRFTQPGFDPTAIRPIISPATQARSRPLQGIDASIPPSGSSPPRISQLTNSPKRPLPSDDSDNDGERPRKLARGESPLKGAAGRRLEQQKRNQQPQGPPQFDQPLPPPPPPSLPAALTHILSNLPKASHYPAHPRFIPHKVVDHVATMNLSNAKRVQAVGAPQQRPSAPVPSRPPQPVPQHVQQPIPQHLSSMPPMPQGGPNPYSGGYSNSAQAYPPASYPQQQQPHQVSVPSGNAYYPGANGQLAHGPGYPYGQGKTMLPQALFPAPNSDRVANPNQL